MTIIFFLITALILWFISIIKKENDEREKHIKHSIRNLRKFVKTYNDKSDELSKTEVEYIDKDKFLKKNKNKRKGKRRMLRYLKCYKMKTDNSRFKRIAKRTFFNCYKNLPKV